MNGNGLPVYQGYASQYGYGLGNVLGGIIRSAIPIVTPIVKNAGKELLLAGAKTLQTKLKGNTHRRPPGILARPRRKQRDIFQ